MQQHQVTQTLYGILVHPDHPTIDHQLPKSLFPRGTYDPTNWEVICNKCNKKKSNNLKMYVDRLCNGEA